MKDYKGILAIIGIIAIVAAAVAAVIIYRDKISAWLTAAKDKLCCCKNKVLNDEFSDFADVCFLVKEARVTHKSPPGFFIYLLSRTRPRRGQCRKVPQLHKIAG